jgi:hypothetical protein
MEPARCQAALGKVQTLGGSERLKPPRAPLPLRRLGLWAVLLAGVALLAWLSWRLIRQLHHAPPA